MANAFNARALSAMGADRATVEFFRQLYDRTGGTGGITVTLDDLDPIVFSIADRLSSLNATRTPIAELEQRVNNLERRKKQTPRDLVSRIETLETLIL